MAGDTYQLSPSLRQCRRLAIGGAVGRPGAEHLLPSSPCATQRFAAADEAAGTPATDDAAQALLAGGLLHPAVSQLSSGIRPTDARHRLYRRPVLPVGHGPSLEPW